MKADNASSKGHRLTKIPSMNPPFELLVSVTQESLKILWAIALGCLQRWEVKSLLLKITCTADARPGGPELELTWKPPPPGGIAFMVPERATQSSKGKEKWSSPEKSPTTAYLIPRGQAQRLNACRKHYRLRRLYLCIKEYTCVCIYTYTYILIYSYINIFSYIYYIYQ